MDDLLKRLAALDQVTLTIYDTLDPNYKKPRKPRAKRVKETPEEPPKSHAKRSSHFDFDEWAGQYESVCEADLELSKMTEKELEELGYFESISETREDFEASLNSFPRTTFTDLRESFYRSDKCTENLPDLRSTKYIDLFNHLALKNTFTANLRSTTDPIIRNKLTKFPPLIAAKCFNEFYAGVKDHVAEHLNMTESIFKEIKSIWSRARPYVAIQDLSSDLRRLRKLKIKQPDLSLADILESFGLRGGIEEFLDKSNVPPQVVIEAGKRIGSHNYGVTAPFAQLIDETNLSEELISETVPRNDDVTDNLNGVTTDVTNDVNDITTTDVTTTDTVNPNPDIPITDPSNLSKKDISKLQRAIKKALKNKLSK